MWIFLIYFHCTFLLFFLEDTFRIPNHEKCFFTRIDIMDTIDISQNIQDFKQVFENESRIIFSAKFGDGKSYFQKKFMESYPKEAG